jgi:prepilin-type N-terminal cleavage/methylation domain-containing protein
MKKSAGFTLVEVLVSIFVGLVIVAAIYAAVVSGQRSSANIERKVVAGQDARAALELMTIEIQMASYNPTNAGPPDNIWMNPVSCTAASGNQNYRGIQAATDSSITIEADINENGGVKKESPNINPNEIITYTYDAANQYITRETSCGGAQPFLGDTVASGHPRSVRVINTAAVPVFQYFDAQGVQIPAAGLPAGIPNIARIDITLWVETEDVDASSGQRRRMVYSTTVIPRNHVF